MLQVWLLGQFEVKLDGRRVVLSARAARSLLAYLILSAGTSHRREKMAGLFWSDLPEENARRNLRNEVWRIRKALISPADNSEYILADELTLSFNPDASFWLDAAQLERADFDLESLISNLSLYRGELLPGMYDDWITLERERLQAVFETKMQTLLEKLIETGRWNTVIEWSERWIAQGQTPEPAYRALMVAHAATGNRAQVAATFERCKTALRDGLAVDPSDETSKVYNELIRGERIGHVDLTPTYLTRLHLPLREEPPAPGEPPFKGLEYFDETDARLFFGREQLTAKLIQDLCTTKFLVVVVGASGSGKSSLVRAGVVPALKSGAPGSGGSLPSPDSRAVTAIILTPTAHPLQNLAIALTRDSESVTATATLIDDLGKDPRALHLFLMRLAPLSHSPSAGSHSPSAIRHVLLVIDQFEELFTLCRDEFERGAFIDNLLTALSYGGDAPLSLVLTLRADFYAHLAQYPELRDAVAKHQEFIGPMNSDELRQAIEKPAAQEGWAFEPGLVDLILRDVGDEPGALPLLSHALLETWKRRSGHTLTLKGYHDAGGVRGAIAQTAGSVFQQFTPHEQTIARDIFLRLTELGQGTEDTRRRASFDELIPHDESAPVHAVLARLADARLITLHQETAEVAHEALIREWDQLHEWLNQDRDALRLHRQITEAANEWESLERDAGALYRGARLVQARDFVDKNPHALNEQERAFVDVSQAQEEREAREREAQQERELRSARALADTQSLAARQLRQRALFLAGAFVLAALLAVIALFLNSQSSQNALAARESANVADQARVDADTQRANAERHSRVALARELAANAVANRDIDPELAVLLALQAVKTTAPDNTVLPEAEDALHRTILGLRLERVLTLDKSAYRGVFTPDGTQVVVMGLGGMKRWDVETGQLLAEYPLQPDVVDNITFSPDLSKIATVDHEPPDINQTAVLKIFDFKTGALLRKIQLPVNFNDTWLECLNPDWTRYAIPVNPDKSLKMYDLASGELLRSFTGHQDIVFECSFSPDGKRIATDSADGTTRVWDADSGRELLNLHSKSAAQFRPVFSPDGTKIATAAPQGTAKIWDAASGQESLTLRGHINNIMSIRWSPDGKRVVTAGFDPNVILWDAVSGESLLSIPAHHDQIFEANFSPDGAHLITASKDGTAKIWDLSPSHELRAIATSMQTRAATDRALTRFVMSDLQGAVSVWDLKSRKPIFTLPPENSTPSNDFQVALSPDGTLVAAQRSDHTYGIWDIASGNRLASFPGAPSDAVVFDFSPDGKRFAAATVPGITGALYDPEEVRAQVWDIATGKELASFHTKNVISVAFNPDGTRLLTGTFEGALVMWDIATGVKTFEQTPHTSFIWSVLFSPDGKRIITASRDRSVKILDAETGKELLAITGFGGTVFRAVYSPDGKTIATSSCDTTAKLFDAETGAEKLTLYSDKFCVYWVAFSPDGKYLITSSDGGGIREYVLDVNELVQVAKSRLTRTWTLEECVRYLHLEKCPPP